MNRSGAARVAQDQRRKQASRAHWDKLRAECQATSHNFEKVRSMANGLDEHRCSHCGLQTIIDPKTGEEV